MGNEHMAQYGQFAEEVRAKQRRYNQTLDELETSLRDNERNQREAEGRCTEQTQRKQENYRQRQTYWRTRIRQNEQEYNSKVETTQEEINSQIQTQQRLAKQLRQRVKDEEDAIKKEEENRKKEEEKRMKEEQRMEEEQKAFLMDLELPVYRDRPHRYLDLELPVYRDRRHRYLPSLSSGVYGTYVMHKSQASKQCGVSQHDQSSINAMPKSQDSQQCGARQHDQGSTNAIPKSQDSRQYRASRDSANKPGKRALYEQIYAATKKVDDKYKLIFKPECNAVGCCNKPEIDAKRLRGDMYLCKMHRVQMVNRIKESGVSGEFVDDLLNKFATMSDEELLQHGEQQEADDYFLKNYTNAQRQRVVIAKRLLTLEQDQSEYWALTAQYKQLQEACDFLTLIRKISNPWWCWLIPAAVMVVVTATVAVGVYLFGNCGSSNHNKRRREEERQRQREERERRRQQEINEALEMMKNITEQLTDKQTMKRECMQLIKSAEEYETELKRLQDDLKEVEWTQDHKDEWEGKIDAKKNEYKTKVAEWDQTIQNEDESRSNEIDAESKNFQNQINAENAAWQQKKADFTQALSAINQEFEDAQNKVTENNAQIAALNKRLREDKTASVKELLELAKELRKLEKERLENEEKRDEKKKEAVKKRKKVNEQRKEQLAEHQAELAKLEAKKKNKIQTLTDAKDKELERLRGQKDAELKRIDTAIQQLEKGRDGKKRELETKRQEIQKKLDVHRIITKSQLEQFKQNKKNEKERLEREEDELQFQRAKTRAQVLSRQTPEEYVAVYVVWEDGKKPGYSTSLYSPKTIELDFESYGKWRIAKFQGRFNKNGTKRTKIEYTTYGRHMSSIHYTEGYYDNEEIKSGRLSGWRFYL